MKKKKDSAEKILVLTQDSRTCGQLKNYLTMGAKEYLLFETMKKLKPDRIQNLKKSETTKTSKPENLNANTDTETDAENEDERESYVLTLSQKPEAINEEEDTGSENINSSQCFEECSQVFITIMSLIE